MIPSLRARFNEGFKLSRYTEQLADLETRSRCSIEFRISETPCFFQGALMDSLVGAAQSMLGHLLNDAEYRAAADAVVKLLISNLMIEYLWVVQDIKILKTIHTEKYLVLLAITGLIKLLIKMLLTQVILLKNLQAMQSPNAEVVMQILLVNPLIISIKVGDKKVWFANVQG